MAPISYPPSAWSAQPVQAPESGCRLRSPALWVGLALLLALAGCQTPPLPAARHPQGRVPARLQPRLVTPPSPARLDNHLDDEAVDRLARAHAAFAEGIVRQINDDTTGMLDYWTRALQDDPKNERLVLEVARRRLARKEFPAALAVLEPASTRPDAAPEVLSLLGLTRLQLGQGPAALEAYRTALRKQPENPAAYAAFARLLLDQDHAADALSTLDAGMAKDPNDPGMILQFAETLQLLRTRVPAQAQPTQARLTSWLDRAAAKKPTDAAHLLRLAELNKSANRPEEAERFFKESKARAPHNPFASARLAEMYLRDGKLSEATEQLESLQRDEPTNPVPWYYLGLLATERRDFKRAEELFSRSLSLNPDQEAALLDLAVAQLSQNRADDALATLARAREKFPGSYRGEFLSALAEGRKKNHVAAREHFLVAERIATTNSPAQLDARFHFQVGLTCSEIPERQAEAEERLQKALKLKPDLDEAQNALGYLWAERGIKLAEAQRLIEAAIKAEPDNPAYLDSLGWVLYKRGNATAALSPLVRAVELTQKDLDPTLLDHLADVYAGLGRWSEARTTWEKALKLGPNDGIQKKLENARGK